MAGPILFEQSRQRPVGQDPPAGLTSRTVIGFTIGVPDSLKRAPADRTRLAEPAMDGHFGTEGGHILGERVARLGAKPIKPFLEHLTGRLIKPAAFVGRQLPGEREGREPGTMKNLIGVGVAYPTEQVRVGQGPLERVVLLAEGRLNPSTSRSGLSRPPGSCAWSVCSPRTRWRPARCLEPASVSSSDPAAKSKAASDDCP